MEIRKHYGSRTSIPTFDQAQLAAPPISCAPVFSWVWNAPVTHEETQAQILEMKRLGIRSFYIIPEPKTFRPTTMPTELEPDYLTPPYFEEFAYAAEFARKNGMVCWLYDEGGWPSGGACGKVLKKYPHLARRSLERRELILPAGEPYHPSSDDVVAAFVNANEMISDGFVSDADSTIDEYISQRHFFRSAGTPDYPDLTRAESTERFIELTHEGYKPYMEKYFGSTVTSVFTDEPKAPDGIPYCAETEEAFIEKYGFSPRPYLPMLTGRDKTSPRADEIRIKWFDLCSELFCGNFLMKCREWSNENGLEFVGHLDRDDTNLGCMTAGNFNLMRALRCFDIPGIDVIWRQIFPSEGKRNGFFPRHASSAAAQVGSHFAFTESMGVYGNGMTFDQMRYVIGHQAIRGINIFNMMLIPYGRSGSLMSGEAPFFLEAHACCADTDIFVRYMEQLTYLFSIGERQADIALYYPIADFQSHSAAQTASDSFTKSAEMLEDAHLDFDIVDDDVFLSAERDALENGVIAKNLARYRVIVVPECRFMPTESRAVLDEFAKNGGRVIGADEAVGTVRPCIDVNGEAPLRLMKRTFVDGELIFCFNESTRTETFTASLANAGSDGKRKYLIIPEDGTIRDITGDGLTLTLLPGQTAAILISDREYDTVTEKTYPSEITLPCECDFRRTKSFVIGEMEYENHVIDEEPAPITLGDWRARVGDNFSGSGTYTIRFAKPEGVGDDFLLDLGDVKYTCSVKLNGTELGRRVMPPYRYTVPSALLESDNTAEITVTNTTGNQYQYTKSFDKWSGWQIPGYYRTSKEFDRDTLPGGLYGPVKLMR